MVRPACALAALALLAFAHTGHAGAPRVRPPGVLQSAG